MLDKFRETAITWDKANRKVYESLRVSAGDNKGRKLSVQVVNGGVVENITGSNLSLFWETRDKAHRGLDVFTAVDATKGEFEIYYTTGMLSNEGVLNANLVLVDTSGRVVSEPFTITVFKGIDDDAIQSSDSFTALTEALIDVSNLEQNYTPRLNDLTAQLQQTEQELNAQLAQTVEKSTFEQFELSTNQQLAETNQLKADKSYVDSNIASVNSKVDGVDRGYAETYATLTDLQTAFPTGNNNRYVVSADGKWYYWNVSAWVSGGIFQATALGANTVKPEHATFLKISSNFFNMAKIENGFSFDNTTGQPVSNPLYGISEFIKVEPNQTYYTKLVTKVGRYDANKNYISQHSPIPEGASWTTNPATEYVRLLVHKNNYSTAQLNKGSVLLPYEPYYIKMDTEIVVEPKVESVGTPHLQPNSVTPDKVSFIQSTSNLINPNTFQVGYSFDNANGQPVANADYGLSDFIRVTPNINLSSKHVVKVGRYDINKNYLGNHSPNPYDEATTYAISATTEYIKVAVRKANFGTVQLNEGSTLLDYEPYGHKLDPSIFIDPDSVGQKAGSNMLDLWVEDRYVVEGTVRGDYTGGTFDSVPTLKDFTTTQMIGLYDDLMARFPDYITKTVLGADSRGENIYRYDFKPKAVPTEFVSNQKINTKFPKMLLISGIHGEEKIGVYNLYQSLKQITENWKNNEFLETLRWNVHFIVVPIVNNYGYANRTRQNENGVDMARNFPKDWEKNTALAGEKTYGGTAPLSEIGAQLVASLIEQNKDAIYFGSFHNFGIAAGTHFIWNASATKLQVQLGKQLVSKLTRKWKKQYEWLPQEDTFYYGYADSQAPVGSEGLYAASLGIQGGTFETNNHVAYAPDTSIYSSIALTMGSETIINWLVLNLRENTKFYNSLL